MPIQTPNLALKKPQPNETADIAVINENMDTIDAQIKEVSVRLIDGIAAHANAADAHNATSAATASRLMLRDVAGRAQVASPAVAADIARLDTVAQASAAIATSINNLGRKIRMGAM